MNRLWLTLGALGLTAVACILATPRPAAADGDDDRYIVVDGYAVHGYANGREIGYQWYPDQQMALEAKAAMEKIETTTGKYYDKVEIKPEQGRIPIPRPDRSPKPPPPDDPPVGPRPGDSRPAATPGLDGTTWVGSETASDTTSLTFQFNKDHTVVAYDDIGQWSGTWKMVGKTNVIIELTTPNAVNYSGQIRGDSITGRAGRPGGRGQWTWSVKLSQ